MHAFSLLPNGWYESEHLATAADRCGFLPLLDVVLVSILKLPASCVNSDSVPTSVLRAFINERATLVRPAGGGLSAHICSLNQPHRAA